MKKIGMKSILKSYTQKGSIGLAVIAATSALSLILILTTIFRVPVQTPSSGSTLAATQVNLLPTADAYVEAANPTKNFGSSDILEADLGETRIVYMKFNLTSLANQTIQNAKLKVFVVNPAPSTSTQNIRLVTNTSWGENTITYGNRPSASTIMAANHGGAAGTWVLIDVKALVNSQKGKILSFAMDATTTAGFGFRSKDSSTNKPSLVIDYTTSSTITPTKAPTSTPTKAPTPTPTRVPTTLPTPTKVPTTQPTPTKTPSPSPSATPTAVPTTAPTLTPIITITPTPTGGGFGGISLGQVVSGTIYITFYSDPTVTQLMQFYIDDKFINQEREYPYSLGGDTNGVVNGFDTRQLTNGQHTLKAEIHYTDGTVQLYSISFTVNNQIQITPICVQPVECLPWSTHVLCIPNIVPFGGWCPPVSVTMIPTPTCIPVPSCVMPNNDWSYCGGNTPTLSAGQRYCVPPPSPPVPTNTPTSSACPLKSSGDGNCDNKVDMIDFEIWRQEFIGQVTTRDADFNSSSQTDLIDYETWRQGFVARLLP